MHLRIHALYYKVPEYATMYGHYMFVNSFNSLWFRRRRDNKEMAVALDHIQEPFVCENHLSRDNLDNLSFCPDICLELFFVHFVLYWLVRSNYWLKLNKWHLASFINIYCKCILIMYSLASIVNDTNSFSIKHT